MVLARSTKSRSVSSCCAGTPPRTRCSRPGTRSFSASGHLPSTPTPSPAYSQPPLPLRTADQKLDMNMSIPVLLREEAEAGIVVLRLNRPDSMNALNSEMVEALYSTFGEMAEDRSVRAIVLTGAGRGFCSGADLNGYGGEHAVDPANPQADLWASFWVQKRIAGLIPLMRS